LNSDKFADIIHCDQTHQLVLVHNRHGMALVIFHVCEGNIQQFEGIDDLKISLHHLSYRRHPVMVAPGDD